MIAIVVGAVGRAVEGVVEKAVEELLKLDIERKHKQLEVASKYYQLGVVIPQHIAIQTL